MRGTIDKLDEWASDGGTQIVAPTAAKIARGWNVGEQPPAQWENYRVNRDNLKINELIDVHDLHVENDYNDSIEDRCAGIPNSAALLNPVNAINRLDVYTPGGVAAPITAACRGYDRRNSRECVFGLCYSVTTKRIALIYNDPSDNTIGIEVTAIVADSSSHIPIDICCDGDYIYVLMTSAGLTNAHIYRYEMGATFAAGFDTSPDGHIEIAGYGAPVKALGLATESGGHGGRRLIVADADHIAFVGGGEVVIVDKELTTFEHGTGSLASLGVFYVSPTIETNGICSDGSRIWFTANCTLDTDPQEYTILLSALISNPADPTGGITRDMSTNPVIWLALYEVPAPTTTRAGVTALIWDGDNVNVLGNGTYKAEGADDPTHYSWNVQFNVASEFAYMPRHVIASGHADGGRHNGGGVWTGRRIAHIVPSCPIANPEATDLWEKCNKWQASLFLYNSLAGGANIEYSIGWANQFAEIPDYKGIALKSQLIPAKASRIADVVFADDCIWALVFYFDEDTAGIDAAYMIRVISISSRE